jgi:hypothetical protein
LEGNPRGNQRTKERTSVLQVCRMVYVGRRPFTPTNRCTTRGLKSSQTVPAATEYTSLSQRGRRARADHARARCDTRGASCVLLRFTFVSAPHRCVRRWSARGVAIVLFVPP